MIPFRFFALTLLLIVTVASMAAGNKPVSYPSVGQLTAYDASFHDVVAADARIEKIAEGFTWAEGPEWISNGNYLLFTDVPENTIYRWSENDGLTTFLKPSGYDGPELDMLREAGANGLLVESEGTLLLADSGTRVIARLDLATKIKTTIAARYNGKRFNSPNDLARRSDGNVFFTDPPYGLKGINDSPLKELAFNGVYRIDRDGTVHLIDDTLSFPNGIALSPDERTLYVSNSDPNRPIWMAYALDVAGRVIDRRVFSDASDLVAEGRRGLPDGMAVAADGRLFASGPGGVIVFNADGKRLGRIETGSAVSNCAFGDNGRSLYMSSHTFVARVPLAKIAISSAVQSQKPASAPSVRDPDFWPTPMMDSEPPELPEFIRERAVLVFSKTNGFRDSEQNKAANAALIAMADARNWDAYASENAAVFNPQALAKFDAIVLSSTSGNIFTSAQREAFRQWLEQGGGLVALHGAGGDHHYDWDWYVDVVLGAQFIAHTSTPEQFQLATVLIDAIEHPATRSLPSRWRREDEWYAFDRVPSGYATRILARLDESSYRPAPAQRMGDHPVIWTRCIGRGRVFYSALGHKPETYSEPLHVQLIDDALGWAAKARRDGCD